MNVGQEERGTSIQCTQASDKSIHFRRIGKVLAIDFHALNPANHHPDGRRKLSGPLVDPGWHRFHKATSTLKLANRQRGAYGPGGGKAAEKQQHTQPEDMSQTHPRIGQERPQKVKHRCSSLTGWTGRG
jgi:hypothetical protein